MGVLSLFDENNPDETGAAAVLVVILGAVAVVALSGFIAGLLCRPEFADGDLDDDEPHSTSPYAHSDLVPAARKKVWRQLTDKYDGDDDFALWIIDQADPEDSPETLIRLAAQRWGEWFNAESEHEVARHEASHVAVGMALGRCPRMAAIWDEDGEFEGETSFYPAFPPIDPVDELWQDLRIAVSGIAAQRHSALSAHGDGGDFEQAEKIALKLVARGRTPQGFTAEGTVENYLRVASDQATEILAAHADEVNALTLEIADRSVIGGQELRTIFATRQTPARSAENPRRS